MNYRPSRRAKGPSAHTVAYRVDEAVDKYNRVAQNQNVVFVHCAMGMSRSASCVIMYLMKRFNLPLEDVNDT